MRFVRDTSFVFLISGCDLQRYPILGRRCTTSYCDRWMQQRRTSRVHCKYTGAVTFSNCNTYDLKLARVLVLTTGSTGTVVVGKYGPVLANPFPRDAIYR